jgi:hypothetical protein
MHRARAWIAITLLALGTASCRDAPPRNAERPTYDPAAVELLSFEAPNLRGGVLQGGTYLRKDVAFWFWAPW